MFWFTRDIKKYTQHIFICVYIYIYQKKKWNIENKEYIEKIDILGIISE